MCGRFTLRRDIQRVRRELRVEARDGDVLWEPRYNIAPTDQVPILVRLESGARDLKPMIWGIPRSSGGRMVPRSAHVVNRSALASRVAQSLLMDFTSGRARKVRDASPGSFTARMTI